MIEVEWISVEEREPKWSKFEDNTVFVKGTFKYWEYWEYWQDVLDTERPEEIPEVLIVTFNPLYVDAPRRSVPLEWWWGARQIRGVTHWAEIELPEDTETMLPGTKIEVWDREGKPVHQVNVQIFDTEGELCTDVDLELGAGQVPIAINARIAVVSAEDYEIRTTRIVEELPIDWIVVLTAIV